MTRPRVLVAVYNPIEFDGRVKRTCAALARDYDVTLLCVAGPGQFATDDYTIIRVAMDERAGRTRKLVAFWTAFIRAAIRLRPRIVYANDFFLPMPGWVASRLTGACFVYDAHELIVPTNGRLTTLPPPIFYRLEKLVVGRAHLVIAANAERAVVMQEHYRLPRQPIAVRNIPPAPSGRNDDATMIAKYPGLRRHDAGDVHVVYMGDMNLDRGLGVLVDALDELPRHFKLVFIGRGPHLAQLEHRARQRGDDRLRMVGSVEHAEVFDAVRQGDIGFVSYSMNTINEILCAPNKLIEYAQAGLPMVATCQPPIRNLFAAYPIGRVVGCSGEVTSAEVAAELIAIAADRARYLGALQRFLGANTWEREASGLLAALRSACA